MRFKLFTSTPGNVAKFAAALGALGLDSVGVTNTNEFNAVTGELTLADAFEVSKRFHELFEREREEAGYVGLPDYPNVSARRRVGKVEFSATSSVFRRGVSLHLSARGERGSVTLHLTYRNRSIMKGLVEMAFEQNFYSSDAAGDPITVVWSSVVADELVALWRNKQDEALVTRMVEIYNERMPPLPLPTAIAYWGGGAPLNVRNWSREAIDPNRFTNIGRGIHSLQKATTEGKAKEILRLVLPGLGDQIGMGLAAWKREASEHFPYLELIYHRTTFRHRDPQTDEEYTQAGAGERWRHDRQPFTIISSTLENGNISSYRIRFEDGYETDAERGEVEFTPYEPPDEADTPTK
jgi:hypothetical protein